MHPEANNEEVHSQRERTLAVELKVELEAVLYGDVCMTAKDDISYAAHVHAPWQRLKVSKPVPYRAFIT